MPSVYHNYYFLNSLPVPVIEYDESTVYTRLNREKCAECQDDDQCRLENLLGQLDLIEHREIFLLNSTYQAELLKSPRYEALKIPVSITVRDASVMLLNCDREALSIQEELMPSFINADPLKYVCLVEDNSSVRALVKSMLQHFNLVVYDFDNPENALEQVLSGGIKCQLLITDLTMPRMDGMSLIEKTCVNDRKMPMMLISGNPSPNTMERINNLDWKLISIIQKPFAFDTLEKTLTLLDLARRYRSDEPVK